MAIEYNFTLDMDRSKRDNNIAYARTGDVDSITINADLVLNGAAYTPSGTNAFFECVTPNGHSVRAAAQKSGSSVSVEVPSAAFQAAGVINVAYFRFETGSYDNPTYVESTEPFAIVVREGIGDNIDAGDYIEEWRGLADKLEAVVAEVEQKADQAEAAINEQKTEVDQLKAQAQKAIAGDVTEVEGAAQSAIAAINKEKADVADAAEDISAAGEQAINTFNSKSTSAINQFNTNADAKLEEVDGMITDAQGDVDAAIKQLETATDKAVDAMEDALGGTTAGSLQNAINRTLKLDVADMTNIADGTKLSSLTNVGSYCCKTAATAAKISDSPVDDSPFNMYVFSSATSGQVMQLVVPIDLNGKPTAEWHVRFGTSSAMDKWSVIGGGADIAAGLGIDVTGDAQKTVALDTDAFYQHHEATDIIQGSTEVTGGGRVKKLTVYGNTRQNLWINPSGTDNGVTVTSNADGSVTLSGTAQSNNIWIGYAKRFALRPGSKYTLSVDKAPQVDVYFRVESRDAEGTITQIGAVYNGRLSHTFTVPDDSVYCNFLLYIGKADIAVSGTYRVMLNDGSEAQPWCPLGLNSVGDDGSVKIVTAGKNYFPRMSSTTSQGITVTANSDGSYTLNGTSSGPDAGILLRNVDGIPKGHELTLNSYGYDGKIVKVQISYNDVDGTVVYCDALNIPNTFTIPESARQISARVAIGLANNTVNNLTVYPQLELGSTATDYEPPAVTTTPVPLDGNQLHSLPDGTRDELRIDGTGAVTLVQRVGSVEIPGDASGLSWEAGGSRAYFDLPNATSSGGADQSGIIMCDVLPPRKGNEETYIITSNIDGHAYVKVAGAASAADVAGKVGGGTLLYPLAEPYEVELPAVTLPDLDSPNYTVFASSNVPVEIEADVVKVDYLPPSDVYTKEEVDKKIEDAGMPDVVPVSQGGTGVTTAAAERNRLGLGNTTGALPIANGGTGKTTAKAAQNALLANIDTASTDAGDDSIFVGYYQSPSDATGALYKRTGLNVWNWIVTKIRSTFGFNSSNVLTVAKGGTGSTSAKAAQNSLLNDMNASSDALTDSSMLVGYNASPSASNGAVHKRTASTVWDYVAGKIRSTFGFSSSNVLPVSHGGTGLTANPSMLVNLGSVSASKVLASSPRPGVTGTLPVSHGGTGATAPGVDMLKNLGITFGTADPPSTGTPGSIYIQYFK